MKKELQKKLSFVLLVMAVFFAGVALTTFSSSMVMICIAGVLLLVTAVFYVLQQETKGQNPSGKATEILLADRMAELMRGNEKAEKGVYIAVKKQHEAMEEGLASLEEKISELIKAQDNAVKTLVLYNKENAKQMALSEREELGRLREELIQQGGKGGQGAMSQVVDAVKEMSRRLYEEFHENGEAILAELETSTDSLEEIKEFMQSMGGGSVPQYMPVASVPEKVDIPLTFEEPGFEEPEEAVVEEASFIPEEIPVEPVVEEVPVAEEEPVIEEEPVLVEEPVEEEVPAKKNPEDALASSGVDLSDPNKTLSPDDIAALIAALGN